MGTGPLILQPRVIISFGMAYSTINHFYRNAFLTSLLGGPSHTHVLFSYISELIFMISKLHSNLSPPPFLFFLSVFKLISSFPCFPKCYKILHLKYVDSRKSLFKSWFSKLLDKCSWARPEPSFSHLYSRIQTMTYKTVFRRSVSTILSLACCLKTKNA